MSTHKHRDLIIAWANGAKIERKVYRTGENINEPLISESWLPENMPMWSIHEEYRIKPDEPRKRDMYLYRNNSMASCWVDERSPEEAGMGTAWTYIGRIVVFK